MIIIKLIYYFVTLGYVTVYIFLKIHISVSVKGSIY